MTPRSELRERFDSCGEAKMELFDYIEVFYNQRRRHSTLGQISPAVFERQAAVSPIPLRARDQQAGHMPPEFVEPVADGGIAQDYLEGDRRSWSFL